MNLYTCLAPSFCLLFETECFGTKIPKRVGNSDPAKFVQQLNDLRLSGWSVLPEYESCEQYYLFCLDFEYNIALLQKVSGKKKVNKGKKLDRVYLGPRPSSTSNPLLLAAADR